MDKIFDGGDFSKFLVLKSLDIQQALPMPEKDSLYKITRTITDYRIADGRNPNPHYLVVNTDEPYAGMVADLIEVGERSKGTWEHEEHNLREVMGINLNRGATLAAQLAEAQADNAALVEALTLISQFNKNNMLQWCIKNNCQFGAGYEDGNALRLRIAQYIVTLPHPGADLLKELSQYKRALELAATGTAKELCITDLRGIDEAPDYCQNNPSEDACIKCWSKLFLAKAKEGDK